MNKKRIGSSASLLELVADKSNLWDAWIEVRRGSLADGQYSKAVRRFSAKADEEISRVSQELLDKTYAPKPFYQVVIPKDDGGERKLAVSAVRDRIVERCVVTCCARYIDSGVSAVAHAYRPGRGVHTALHDVAKLRDEGKTWCCRMDIDDCFDNVPREAALEKFSSLVARKDASISWLVRKLVDRPIIIPSAMGDTTHHRVKGIPQGCALSPMLVNLALKDFDDHLQDRGFQLVRYSDDIAVLGETRHEVEDARIEATRWLERNDMALNVEDSEIMSFDEGFCFLGQDVGPQLPAVDEFLHMTDHVERTLFVGHQGSNLRVSEGRVIVEDSEDEVLIEIPQSHVRGIVCFGAVGVSAGVRAWALFNGVPISFLSRRGSYLGYLESAHDPTRVTRLRAQLQCMEDQELATSFARRFVISKISHQLTLLRRHNNRIRHKTVKQDIDRIKRVIVEIEEAQSVQEILGFEGIAAKHYFHSFGLLLPEDVRFTLRSRRPPHDVANAALGYGYAVLASEATSALVAAGLDPQIGVMHKSVSHETRASLALDLMEEFRPYVVDHVVMSLCKKGSLRKSNGVADSDRPHGVLLDKKGKQALLKAYESRMLQHRSGAIPGFSGSTRRLLFRQAEVLMLSLCNGDPTLYHGFSWR